MKYFRKIRRTVPSALALAPKTAALVAERSRTYFANDKNYPGAWEPGGEDFFSPALMEADLMRRVLNPDEFRRWFQAEVQAAWPGAEQALLLLAGEGRHYTLLFSHDFARAMVGLDS